MRNQNRCNEGKNKTPDLKINYFYVSMFCRPKFINYLDNENR